jgi:signal transduction histidine kinase
LGHVEPGDAVQVVARRDGDRCLVQVIDDGEGLSDDQSRLTERFARGTDRVGGPAGRRFGLGLTLVREVATAHRGAFSLDPRRPRGVVATLTIPAMVD